MAVMISEFGTLEDGRKVTLYTLTNGSGTEASFIDLGAAWVSMKVKDREGNFDDVVFGYDDPKIYEKNPTCAGEIVGRSANRIGGAEFTIDGVRYELAKNNNGNNLHSGPDKWDRRLFCGEETESKLGSCVTFSLREPDGSQGYPGNLDFKVSYTLAEDNSLIIEYQASADKKTIINPTNHAYFNLAGHAAGSILDQQVWINADSFTPSNEVSIPTGEIRSVEGTPMDFTIMKPIGQDIDADYDQLNWAGGYDHNYVLNGYNGRIRLSAKAVDEKSGRMLKVYTDMPGMQFYTGNSLKEEAPKGKGGAVYARRTGYCFETQFYPDAVNKAEAGWPQPVFAPGEEFKHITIYRFVTDADEEETD